MTRYDAILLALVILFTGFVGYFVYREWTDPILFPGGQEKPVTEENEEASKAPDPYNLIPLASEEQAKPKPKPKPEAAKKEEPVKAEDLQASMEEALTQQVGQLAALMETQLASSVNSAEDRISAQSEKLESASQIIDQALGTYQENTRLSVEGLSETLNLIDDMQNESEAITAGLQNARDGWDQLFDDVADIGERSEDRLDEANFEFQTYTVKGTESLSDISRALQAEYNLPESDVSFLLNRFNDIDYRLYDPGGRRPAYRVVANDSLRVPVPKTTAGILKDYALPDKLSSQIAHINQAASANDNLQKSLSRQVNKLKSLEANVQAIAAMTETLEQVDLSTQGPIPDNTNLSPELQDAWQQFENSVEDFRSASGFEEEQIAREKLQQSISRLLNQYEQNYMKTSDTETDPLEYYLRFIEKYRPENSGS